MTAKREMSTPASDPATGRDVPVRVDLAAELAFWATESELFNPDHELFRMAATPGLPRLAVAVGPNASGKSMLVRAFAAKCGQAGMLPFTVSLRHRTGSDGSDIAGFRKVMMYGDDSSQSTGAGSVNVVRNAIEKNLDRPQGSVLLLDEPELGLSEGYVRALGEYIGASVAGLPDVCSGILVITHSRALVGGLIAGAGASPSFAYLGDDPVDLDGWLAREESFSVDELLALPEVNISRFRQAQDKILSRGR